MTCFARAAFLPLLLVITSVPGLAAQSTTLRPSGTEASKGREENRHGRSLAALEHFDRAVKLARQDHNVPDESRALLGQMGTQIRLFRYRAALVSADQALKLTETTHDALLQGAISNNLATIYQQVGDSEQALHAAEMSVNYLRKAGDRKDYLAKALLNLGDILTSLKNAGTALAIYQEATAIAHASGFRDIEAQADDHLGQTLTDINDFPAASKALMAAHSLLLEAKDTDKLALVTSDLAVLAYKQHDYMNALHLIDIAATSSSFSLRIIPPYESVNLRGKILRELGRGDDALLWFEKAVKLADQWTRNAPPGDSTTIRTSVLLHDVYQDYIQMAAHLAIARHNPALSEKALSVLTYHRAFSLRQQTLATLQRDLKLPPQYFSDLEELQQLQAQVSLRQPGPEHDAARRRLIVLRRDLVTMEMRAGLEPDSETVHDTRGQSKHLVKRLQMQLRNNEMLLTYSLSKPSSYVWAISRYRIELRELEVDDSIAEKAVRFRKAVQESRPFQTEGMDLARAIFPSFSGQFYQMENWILVPDGALLDSIPFSCLPNLPEHREQDPVIASKTLRFLPSVMILNHHPLYPKEERFVGVADPIYNLADARRRHTTAVRQNRTKTISLARLVATNHEAVASAAASGARDVQILSGRSASVAELRKALSKPPTVLHFALHIVSPNDAGTLLPIGNEAGIALSLTDSNFPELITKEVVATLSVPGTIVVMNGCASQQGEILPSAGLIGLSRAWLLAGASAVIVSSWPTKDTSGAFFLSFYKSFRQNRSSDLIIRATAALKDAENEMRQSRGYQGNSAYWAAYSLITGGA